MNILNIKVGDYVRIKNGDFLLLDKSGYFVHPEDKSKVSRITDYAESGEFITPLGAGHDYDIVYHYPTCSDLTKQEPEKLRQERERKDKMFFRYKDPKTHHTFYINLNNLIYAESINLGVPHQMKLVFPTFTTIIEDKDYKLTRILMEK